MAGQSALNKLPTAARVGIGAFFVVVLGAAYWLVFYSEVDAKITAAHRQQNELTAELAKQKQAQASYFADRPATRSRPSYSQPLGLPPLIAFIPGMPLA